MRSNSASVQISKASAVRGVLLFAYTTRIAFVVVRMGMIVGVGWI